MMRARELVKDHPRSRGVYCGWRGAFSWSSGSSPLARGLPLGAEAAAHADRIIPARAGFTALWRGPAGPHPDHPRSRGVYAFVFCSYVCSTGSSPLARGLRHRLPPGDDLRGIIPARAGFTDHAVRRRRDHGDHPRSRGVYICADGRGKKATGSSPLARGLPGRRRRPAEARRDHPRSRGVYGGHGGLLFCSWGSSPLARGLRRADGPAPPLPRIIPARAGFTRPAGPPTAPRADHPRSRGVYRQETVIIAARPGSSPLARGLPCLCLFVRLFDGIIPARAGFTWAAGAARTRRRDHPRSRGVYRRRPAHLRYGPGSSPLARGLLRSRAAGLVAGGIIPARAGFTSSLNCPGPGTSDHPRSRGVYWWRAAAMAVWRGSSPLARGLHEDARTMDPAPGIIPARAGFTGTEDVGWEIPADHPRSRGVYGVREERDVMGPGSSPLARGLPIT